jgi:hypothetical protein
MEGGWFADEESILESRALARAVFGHLIRQTKCLEALVAAQRKNGEAPPDW